MSSNLRILYVPNEAGDFRQIGFRRPLANLVDAGLVQEVSIFSLQWRQRNGGDHEQHRQDLIARVAEFQPNMVIMQHLNTTGLNRRHFAAMRNAADFELIYHEGDPYSRYLHPLPSSARLAGRFSDVVFTVGAGVFSENFRRSGAKDVRYAPSAFQPERYRQQDPDPGTRQFDVVVVANRNSPRFRGHPNWRERIAFVRHLQERLGDRLAIYGRGWEGPGALGPISTETQDVAVRSGWISANWDHYASEPYYFSNRLPISLASGSIHATTEHPGYSRLFPARETGSFLVYEKSYLRLAESIERHLDETSVAQRLEAYALGQQFAHRYYRQDDQFLSFLNYRDVRIDPTAARESWDLDAVPLDGL